jgi:5-methylcytosine-specific restriction endonuclease McrA
MRKHIIWQFETKFLQEILDNSKSYVELFDKMNLKVSKSLIKMLQYRIKKENLNREKFIDNTKKNMFSFERKLDDVLVENSTYLCSSNLKIKLLKYELIKYQCDICGISKWNGKTLVLQLDHINGINNDNRIENLRLLCPNCHSQTETYAGKKKKEKNKQKKLRKFCNKCGIKVDNKVFCQQCDIEMKKNRRKVERPPKEELIKLINDIGYSATGRKYGVSDNAIRKWLKYY